METVVSRTVIPALKRKWLACFMCTVCCLIVNPLAPELIPGVICRTQISVTGFNFFMQVLTHTQSKCIFDFRHKHEIHRDVRILCKIVCVPYILYFVMILTYILAQTMLLIFSKLEHHACVLPVSTMYSVDNKG